MGAGVNRHYGVYLPFFKGKLGVKKSVESILPMVAMAA